jgi:hypothetical protein
LGKNFVAPAQLDPVHYAGRSMYLVADGPAPEPLCALLHAARLFEPVIEVGGLTDANHSFGPMLGCSLR